MWKKVIGEEAQNQGKEAESGIHLNNVAEPILAIHEEEEEPGSREEQVEGEEPEEAVEEVEWPPPEESKSPGGEVEVAKDEVEEEEEGAQ